MDRAGAGRACSISARAKQSEGGSRMVAMLTPEGRFPISLLPDTKLSLRIPFLNLSAE
jgi:hypothetical protein